MAKKSDTGEALGILLGVLFIGIIIFLWAIKWILLIIIGVIGITVLIIKKVNNKSKINKIIKESFDNTNIKVSSNISINKIKEDLNLFDMKTYNDLFEEKIRVRGKEYYYKKKVQKLKKNESVYSATVNGTKEYTVTITFEKEDKHKISNANCNCIYYTDEQHYCKHIYAMLLKIKCDENRIKTLEELIKVIKDSNQLLQQINNKFFSLNYINQIQRTKILNAVNDATQSFSYYKNKINENLTEEQALDSLYGCIKNISKLTYEINEVLASNGTNFKNLIDSSKINCSEVLVGIDIASKINEYKENEREKINNKKIEDECNLYGLIPEEVDIVKEGVYEKWDFEEEMDEDSYYNEDDIGRIDNSNEDNIWKIDDSDENEE